MELAGKVAVVTGASSGIGEASARALARAGMTVVAAARRGDRLEALARGDDGAEDGRVGRIVPHVADVTDDESVAGLVTRVTDELGGCHVLVNNAGAVFGRRFRGPADLADLERTLALNVVGTARCMAAFAALLEASAPSRVINIGSIAGKVGFASPAYTASKFATVGLSEATRFDWARRGVAVCQLNPGFIRTEGFPQEELLRSPVRRLVGTPEMVAEAVVAVARSGAHERSVPRWYRLLVVARHLAAPAFYAAARRVAP
jgi:NAD(P)-dependent dehydrogenase (short-subunit alcohol dehydrogenase family)